MKPDQVKKPTGSSNSLGSSCSAVLVEEERHKRNITNSLVQIYGKFEQFMKRKSSD